MRYNTYCNSYMRRLPYTLLLGLVGALLGGSATRFVRTANSISPGFAYGSDKVRGVNIGGWLVTEPWITPSLFDQTGNDAIVDEWTFCQYQDRSVAEAALSSHWETFYTEDDFRQIAEAGLNHVRIPIGYWAFEVGPDEHYISGQLPYLQKAIEWASNYGLKVIVDLHGAPGSQNGYDNSGQRLSAPGWHSNSTNVDRTIAVLKTIADMFVGNPDVVPVVAPLNEPAGYYSDDVLVVTKQYWRDSFGYVRYGNDSAYTNTVVLIHDAFQSASYWSGFLTPPDAQGAAIDTHIYQVFSNDYVEMSQEEHIALACNQSSTLSQYEIWTIVGEWSPAMTDCAKYLNGRGIGARYDGTYSGSTAVGRCDGFSGSSESFSDDYKTFLRKYWEAQATAYETNSGWIQWTWKTENGTGEEWSYKAGLDHGWIPSDPTDRQYPNICN